MSKNLTYKALSILAVTLACFAGIFGLPTSMESLRKNFQSRIHLGLDLKGGSQLVMQIQLQDAFKTEADTVIQRLRQDLSGKGIPFTDINRNDPNSIETAASIEVNVLGVPSTRAGDFRTVVQDNYGQWNMVTVGPTDYRLTMKPTEALILKQDALAQTMSTIQRKIDGLGLAESSVQQRGGANAEAEILVQLPGVEDPARIKQMLQTVGKLELREVQGGPFSSREDAVSSRNGILGLGSEIVRVRTRGGEPASFYILARTPVVTGRDLRNAQAQQNATTRAWETTFVLTQDAAARFERFTGANIGRQLAIVLDGAVLSAPTIQGQIRDQGVIENIGSREEAADLALNLRAGSLPAGLVYLEERTVGPSLGADSIRSGMMAGAAGLIAVVAVMLIYYKHAGVNATVALILNALILIAALGYFGATLTLPGIAGVILTIGMAVDSNVLIFERIREELRGGKAIPAAIDLGFNKAVVTIMDTHVTTIVSCAFLFLFGTGPVKGFAITLTIGLLANLFTAIFVSRVMFEWSLNRHPRMQTLSI
jgi:preprotein translocase subunit SecD